MAGGGALLATAAVGAASGGLQGYIRGKGEQAAANYSAARAGRAAEIARLQSQQIDVSGREELASTISNIRAIRASAGVNPDSPSTRAFVAEEERVSSRERRIRIGSARMQAAQYEADAAFYRDQARSAPRRGLIGGFFAGLG